MNKEEDFWSHVKKSKDCWEWTGPWVKFGYGIFNFRGKSHYAHRACWIFKYGEIPEGLWVLHKCDNPPCVRPDHLWLGTKIDNDKDRDAKKRFHITKGDDCGWAKLSSIQVRHIKELLAEGVTIMELARGYNVSRCSISDILHGRSWASV